MSESKSSGKGLIPLTLTHQRSPAIRVNNRTVCLDMAVLGSKFLGLSPRTMKELSK